MAKTSESDVWDQDPPGGSGRVGGGSMFVVRTNNVKVKQAAKVRIVRDDWDDDDDDDDEQEKEEEDMSGNEDTAPRGKKENPTRRNAESAEEDSTKIWAEANKWGPMPELIVASATTRQSLPPPPPAALQPTLRILKRPSANNSTINAGILASSSGPSSSPGPISGSGGASPSPAPRGTLAEREAQYQEARSRIFGEGSVSRTNSPSADSSGVVAVVRDPLGPAGVPSEAEPDRPVKGFGERQRTRK